MRSYSLLFMTTLATIGCRHPAASSNQGGSDDAGGKGGGGSSGGASTSSSGGSTSTCDGEVCDGEDNDCNGKIDDDPEGEGDACDAGQKGVCAPGVKKCHGKDGLVCEPATKPGQLTEHCNGLDDDCDGQVDEDLGNTTCGVGACQTTVSNCAGGAVQTCTPKPAGLETCNGIDDDCDGVVDDGLGTTTCGLGLCTVIAQTCVAGQSQICMPLSPSPEVCNGLDDNCNGVADEGLGTSSCGAGACAVTVQACLGGQVQACVPKAPTTEVCDGVDNDCDGQIDEGLGSIQCGVGACATSVQKCVGGVPQACVPKAPTTEVCDGVDNDCDGQLDEGVKNACGQCGAPPAEMCDGVDNDCDGQIDEGLPGCGLTYMCKSFSFSTAPGTSTVSVTLPSGDYFIPVVERRSWTINGEADGAWDFNYSNGTFTYTAAYGSANETVAGRVCVLGVGDTVEAAWTTNNQVTNGQNKLLSVSVPANPFGAKNLTLGFVRSYWSGTDDDFAYGGQLANGSLSISPTGGGSGSWVEADLIGLSLPAGYIVTQKPFKVFSGGSTTLSFTDDPGLGQNLMFVSVLSYQTAAADYFSYNSSCTTTSCTISASNGSASSYVDGYVTQIQWVDNQ